MADYVAEPAPVENGNLQIADLTSVAIDPSASPLAFAGQTVRLRIATTNNRGLLIVGVDDANIQARASTDGGISDLVVDPRNRDTVYLGGAALGETATHEVDHWLGRAAANNGGISKLGSKLLVIQGDGNYDTNDDNNHGTHVAGTIGAIGNNGVGVAGSAGNVDRDSVDDIIVGAEINGHVKASDGTRSTTSGSTVGTYQLAFEGQHNTVSGKVTGIAVDPSDRVGGLGDDRLVGGTGQDSRNAGAPNGRLYLGTQVGVYAGGGDDDVLIGGGTQRAPSGAGLDILIANTGGDRLATTFDAQGRLLIGTEGGLWVADDELSLLSKSQVQNESGSNGNTGTVYYTGSVTVSDD